ncbi:ERF family protein [Microvirga lenta]|uniref:ERF family protein n=1 Tax=Microvirga lenta TaxID=2881337 RepID=UPI001CFD8FFC|nr:ERF family protein [Microvirga lenta]MCB5173687.1 ERF family protein [Microvirga lenta]
MSSKNNAVAVQEAEIIENLPAASQASSESAAIIQVIERAAMNPAVDIDKMERLLEMQERIMNRNAKAAYTAALAAMQPDLPVITERGGIKDRSGKVQSTYALWEDINEAIKPILAKHGFALSFRTGQEDGKIVVTGVLSHRDGHSEETTMFLPIDASGSKNAVQAVGSSTSYGKRYTAQALLNLTSRGEDDDGSAAGAPLTISEEQVEALQDLIIEVGADPKKFCAYLKVGSLNALPADQYQRALDALNAKRAK